jgi:AraC family transcriptional regulator, transcriptional activator of pobA
MRTVENFKEINDYMQRVGINLPRYSPDFQIYQYQELDEKLNYSLPAYKHHFFEITLDISSVCNFTIDNFQYPDSEHIICFISPFRLQSVEVSPQSMIEAEGFTVFFKPEFLGIDAHHTNFLRDFPFFQPENEPVLRLSSAQIREFADIFQKISYEYRQPGAVSQELIQTYLRVLLLLGKKNYVSNFLETNHPSRENEIFTHFYQLLQSRFLDFKTVNEFANHLNISPKHLSETIKKVSGKTALQLINEKQAQYAQSLLKQTKLNINEIAYELNFESPDYFTTFFKRMTGQTPSQFRHF